MAQLNTRPNVPFGTGGAHKTQKMFYVYVLYSSKVDGYYLGITNDVDRRLIEHNNGNTQSTRYGIPWMIAHKEVFETRKEARTREKYLKSAAGRRWRRHHIRPRGATE